MLRLKNISKQYIMGDKEVCALNDISLDFRENEFISILGVSGCGKTTLLNIIGGLDKPSSGELLIFDKSSNEYSEEEWDNYRRSYVSFVFQSYNLIPQLNVFENVELSLIVMGMNKNERKNKVLNALERVGLKNKMNNKISQLSGGEIQRVAIARALVTESKIILLDEPTGSLDNKTSLQIMDLLKKISQDKLIIMVTHNREIAKKYSDRLIELCDGKVIKDSGVKLNDNEISQEKINKKSSMNIFAAFRLSIKNLFSKRIRTFFTALAGALGILGIALVFALSNGFDKYINKLENDTLSKYPLTISSESINVDKLLDTVDGLSSDLDRYPKIKEVYVNKVEASIKDIVSNNKITKEYVDNVIKNIDPNLINGVSYQKNVEMNIFTNSGYMKQEANGNDMHIKLVTDYVWQEMINNEEFINQQFDVLEGRLPREYNEIVIVVDRYNRMTNAVMIDLGIYVENQKKETFTFDELMDLEFKLLTNDEMYYYQDGLYKMHGVYLNGYPMVTNEAYNSGVTLDVVGIIRANESTNLSSLNTGVGYNSKLVDYIIERDKNSTLADYMIENKNINPFTGLEYSSTDKSIDELYKADLRKYGVDDTPSNIKIYAKDFKSKEKIKSYLDEYNKGKNEDERIIYSDVIAIFIETISSLINGISYVLMAISIISLLVSLIMISIITYISVAEREKEIGILRSIGARKKDIARIFNIETFMLGIFSGIFGIILCLLISIPINLIMNSLVVGMGGVASLDILDAFYLIVINSVLTVISGYIPVKIASRKDPAIALRRDF